MAQLDPSVLIGSQYYVNNEDTPQVVAEGIRAMARAGLKLVRIFLQWTQVERREGRWDWSQYDALFDAADEGGIGVIVTLTALHPPGWMKISYGPQDVGPLYDPAYWERAMDYLRRVVQRYGKHPAMHSWILNNEPQWQQSPEPVVMEHFRRFIANQYSGDIERFNQRSYQQLDSFDEVSAAGSEGGFSAYTGRLSWLNFSIHRLQEVLAALQDEIRAQGDTHPIHVNPHGLVNDMYRQGQSIWAQGRLVDFMGCSAHPSWHSTRFLPDRLHQSVALFADMMRGATRAPERYFWVTELQGGTNIYSGLTYLGPGPGEIRSWIWEAIGAGAKAVVFWCFNARVQGYEAGEWSLVDQLGGTSPRLNAASEIAALLEHHRDLFAASRPVRSRVALLCSEATWKLGSVEGKGEIPDDPRNVLMGADALAGAFQACADAGLAVDILDESDLQAGLTDGYPILILPGCTALEDNSLTALQRYVEAGGALLADGLCGYKRPDGWLRDPRTNPLNDLFSAAVADIQAIPAAQQVELTGTLNLPAWFLKIALEPREGVKVMARLGQQDARPAITVAGAGKGRAIRLGTVFFQRYFHAPDAAAFARILTLLPSGEENASLLNPSPWLRLRRLGLPNGELLVLINSGEAVEAELWISPELKLERLVQESLAIQSTAAGFLRVSMPAQDAAVFRASAG